MNDASTSPEAVNATARPVPLAHRPASIGEEWSAYRQFIARPVLPEHIAGFSAGSIVSVLRMLALDILLMGALAVVAGTVVAVGFELPQTALAGMEITALLALAIVVGAPLTEEIAFRGWLSGRKRQLIAFAVLLAAVIAAPALGATGLPGAGIWSIALLSFAVLLAIVLFWTARHHPPMRWFQRAFPLLFWLSTLAFACVHLFNFAEGALWILLPLVLPQFILGSILGYLRVRYGLWSSILLHALHNGTALGLVWLGTTYAAGAGA